VQDSLATIEVRLSEILLDRDDARLVARAGEKVQHCFAVGCLDGVGELLDIAEKIASISLTGT
jgi:hypothetical protein